MEDVKLLPPTNFARDIDSTKGNRFSKKLIYSRPDQIFLSTIFLEPYI